MAVAADSHRDFLIPEHTVLQYARQPACLLQGVDPRLFFCKAIVAQRAKKINRFAASFG